MATVSDNNTFLVEIEDVFGGLLKGEKHPFHRKKMLQTSVLLLYLTTEHMASKLSDPRK
jgi:hypothetical protein